MLSYTSVANAESLKKNEDEKKENEETIETSFNYGNTTFTIDQMMKVIKMKNPFEDPESTKTKKEDLLNRAKYLYELENKDILADNNVTEINEYIEDIKDIEDIEDIEDELEYEVIEDEKTPIENENTATLESDISEKVAVTSKKYGVEEKLINSIIKYESNFNSNLVSSNNNGTVDRGLMQINSNTSPWLSSQLNIVYKEGIEFNSEINIEMGTYYLNYLKKFNSDLHYILTAYNKGPTGAERWFIKNKTYESEYSKLIINIMEKSN
jgi:hypothetical protein